MGGDAIPDTFSLWHSFTYTFHLIFTTPLQDKCSNLHVTLKQLKFREVKITDLDCNRVDIQFQSWMSHSPYFLHHSHVWMLGTNYLFLQFWLLTSLQPKSTVGLSLQKKKKSLTGILDLSLQTHSPCRKLKCVLVSVTKNIIWAQRTAQCEDDADSFSLLFARAWISASYTSFPANCLDLFLLNFGFRSLFQFHKVTLNKDAIF